MTWLVKRSGVGERVRESEFWHEFGKKVALGYRIQGDGKPTRSTHCDCARRPKGTTRDGGGVSKEGSWIKLLSAC